MTSSHLIPTPIVDKTGKQTTVHKRAVDPSKGTANFPSPKVSMSSQAATEAPAVDAYKDRLEKIAVANAEWREVGELSDKERGSLATQAFSAMSWMMNIVAKSYDRGDQSDFADEVQWLSEAEDFAPVILADRFGITHSILRNQEDGNDDNIEFSFEGEDTSDWDSSNVAPKDFVMVINAAVTLTQLDLRARNSTPEHGDARFFAHLYMSATETINYRKDDEPEIVSLIKLVDEFPERSEMIKDGIDDGLHAEGIRALIQGSVHKNLAEGVL